MKHKHRFIILLSFLIASLVLTGIVVASSQQTSGITWNVIGNGGGHLEQGNLSLDATIGQPVVGQLSNGNVELCAGFWCEISTQSAIYLPLVLRGG